MKFIVVLSIIFAAGLSVSAQKNLPAGPRPAAAVKVVSSDRIDKGTVKGQTYSNRALRFQVTFPETWIVADDEFSKEKRFDTALRAPQAANARSRNPIDSALSRLTILVTAYKFLPEFDGNAEIRVAAEDLKPTPQIKDAVDYLDAVRLIYSNAKLPSGFSYSETKAERLGQRQFAYIDLTTAGGKSRMYVTVRGPYAILFRLSYTDDGDLRTFRQVLAKGDFALK